MSIRQNIAIVTAVVIAVSGSSSVSAQQDRNPSEPRSGERPKGQGQRERPSGGANFERIADRFDTDKDGKVTKKEWTAPERIFARMDRNSDGVITAVDFERRGSRQRDGGRQRDLQPSPLQSDAPSAPPRSLLPQDEKGWTILKPSADSRIMYVSSSEGNDATGRVYAPGNAVVGADPFKPSGVVKAYKTIAAALNNAREQHPDWVLLKRGDQWSGGLGSLPNGRGEMEPFVVGAWGTGKERAMIDPRSGRCVQINNRSFHDIVVTGLEFCSRDKDPQSPRYAPDTRRSIFGVTVRGVGQRLLVEDCRFRFVGVNLTVVRNSDGSLRNIAFRRNLILDNYSVRTHAQGMFALKASVLLEENVFDHNGWLIRKQEGVRGPTGGQATEFNHNTYFSSCHDVIFRGNMFLRGSSGNNKWTANYGQGSSYNLTMENNLYVEGEVAISAGGNMTGAMRFRNITIKDNVIMHVGRSRPTGRTLGWCMWLKDWDGGLVQGNLMLHQGNDKVVNVYGIYLGIHNNGRGAPLTDVHSRNVMFRDNIIYGLKSNSPGIIIADIDRLENITFSRNQVQFPGLKTPVLQVATPISGVTFSKNRYFSGASPGQWFHMGDRRAGASTDLKGWAAASGEKNAEATKTAFVDSERSVESYNASLGGKPTLEDFIARVRQQSKANWRKEYSAAAVNDYIRAGFRPASIASDK